MYFLFCFFKGTGDHRNLHSFPTRRSSDLEVNLVALPHRHAGSKVALGAGLEVGLGEHQEAIVPPDGAEEALTVLADPRPDLARSEEHTSELQSPCNFVCRLLLDKKTYTLE